MITETAMTESAKTGRARRDIGWLWLPLGIGVLAFWKVSGRLLGLLLGPGLDKAQLADLLVLPLWFFGLYSLYRFIAWVWRCIRRSRWGSLPADK